MKRAEILNINNKIDDFFTEYEDCLSGVSSTFTVEEYIDFFCEKHSPAVPLQFKLYYMYEPDIIRKYSDNIVGVYQPSEVKNGFLTSIIQINDKLHCLAQCVAEIRDNDNGLIGVNPLFVSFDGVGPIMDWKRDNAEFVHVDAYKDEEKETGFSGFSSP